MSGYEISEAALDKLRAMTDKVDGIADLLSGIRTPSKARLIGSGSSGPTFQVTPEPGEFLLGIVNARSSDYREQEAGQKALADLGVRYADEDEVRAGGSKATLGTTDATGGWIMPNALVDTITKAATYDNVYRSLVTVRTGVSAATVDVPFRSSRPARAVIAAWGDAKENVNLAYNGYTATMYTLARIHDASRQMVRKSAGAAEADVLGELATALALGEAYYIREGSGSSQPYGLYTALTNSPATFTSSHTPSATTLAGSVLKAITTCLGALASRGVTRNLSAVISGTAWGTMIGQGTDTAGFFLNGTNGVSIPDIAPGVIVTPWGTPVYVDDQATDDRIVVGQFSALKLYVGDQYRVDTSEVAGSRWDNNLVGFRAEEEIAMDARPAVYAGYFQQVTDLLP